MASTKIIRTFPSSGDLKTWTWSGWVKRSALGSTYVLMSTTASVGTSTERFFFNSSDQLEYDHDIAGTDYTLQSDMLFRDTSAYYHIVVAKDTTQATETNRLKIYVNGTQIALTEVALGYPPEDYEGAINLNVENHIGVQDTSDYYFDGLMSHVHFIDGTAYPASTFGSTDATTGEWKINTGPSVTYGTNGAFILKDGNSVTDQSGEGNDWTVGGTLTNTEDNPSNVFATLNANNNYFPNQTLSNGNTSFTQPASTYASTGTTLGMVPNSGKFYAEMKCTYVDGWGMVGIFGTQPTASGDDVGKEIDGYSYLGGSSTSGSAQKRNNATNASYDSTFTANDIISVAVDLDNYKIYFGKNGTWLNSGDPTSGATGTGSAFTISQTPSSGAYFFGAGNWDGDQGFNGSWNFGNGYFGTTAVASAGTNASNLGIFEYDVPTGYTALCTKGLNE